MAYNRRVWKREAEDAHGEITGPSMPTSTINPSEDLMQSFRLHHHHRRPTVPSSSTTKASLLSSTTAESALEISEDAIGKTGKAIGVSRLPILIGVSLVIIGICAFFIRRYERRGKDGKKDIKGVDLKSIQIIGSAHKEKPDMEGLTENAQELDEGESQQSKRKLGKLQYKLEYDFNSNSLTVTVIQADELPTLDLGGTSDPCVQVYLLPDNKQMFETKVLRKTQSPVFNESFTIRSLPYADAMNKTLVFAIIDFDRLSKHDQIGEVKVPLCQIDLAQTIEEWRELHSVEGEGRQAIQ